MTRVLPDRQWFLLISERWCEENGRWTWPRNSTGFVVQAGTFVFAKAWRMALAARPTDSLASPSMPSQWCGS